MAQRGSRRVRGAERQISAAGAKITKSSNSVPNAQSEDSGSLVFTVEQFRRIARIVVKANPETASQLGALRRRLSDLLMNAGLIDDGTEKGKEFRKLAVQKIDHERRAQRFRKIATAGNPLKPRLYVGNMMAELCLALREPRKRDDPIIAPYAPGRVAVLLAQRSVSEVKAAARHLAVYHQAQVRPGPARRHDLDAILDELGDIYANVSAYKKHRHCLSISERSLFGKFCRAVLEPHCKTSDCTFSALSHRWERIKEHASRPAERVKRAPKRVLRPRKKQTATAS